MEDGPSQADVITEEGALEPGTVADDCVSAWCSAHCCQPAHGGRQDAEPQSAGGAGRGQPRSLDRGCLSPAVLQASGRWQQETFCGTRLPGCRGDPRAGPVPLYEHHDRFVPHDGHSGNLSGAGHGGSSLCSNRTREGIAGCITMDAFTT